MTDLFLVVGKYAKVLFSLVEDYQIVSFCQRLSVLYEEVVKIIAEFVDVPKDLVRLIVLLCTMVLFFSFIKEIIKIAVYMFIIFLILESFGSVMHSVSVHACELV